MRNAIDQVVTDKKQLNQVIFRAGQQLQFGENDKWHVIIKRWQPKRTLAQNRLYWAWMRQIANFVNESQGTEFADDDFHDYFKTLFLDYSVAEMFGQQVVRYKSTTELGIARFQEYLEAIELWAGEKNIPLEKPVEYYTAMRKTK